MKDNSTESLYDQEQAGDVDLDEDKSPVRSERKREGETCCFINNERVVQMLLSSQNFESIENTVKRNITHSIETKSTVRNRPRKELPKLTGE
ncbi:hypothetical protein WA026_010154 [Henosepilachna vigintioctopunctata]|uniref:Uncharacterized protein n=1 Tax=Henosepilachna vigintioctopunctata TaxID=420089 RepID=A0AAW1UID2_9CUCU